MKSFYLFLITITTCMVTSKPAYSFSEPEPTEEENWAMIDTNLSQVAAGIADSFSCENIEN